MFWGLFVALLWAIEVFRNNFFRVLAIKEPIYFSLNRMLRREGFLDLMIGLLCGECLCLFVSVVF